MRDIDWEELYKRGLALGMDGRSNATYDMNCSYGLFVTLFNLNDRLVRLEAENVQLRQDLGELRAGLSHALDARVR